MYWVAWDGLKHDGRSTQIIISKELTDDAYTLLAWMLSRRVKKLGMLTFIKWIPYLKTDTGLSHWWF